MNFQNLKERGMESAVQQLVFYFVNVANGLQNEGLSREEIVDRLKAEIVHFAALHGFFEEFRLPKLILEYVEEHASEPLREQKDSLDELCGDKLPDSINTAITALCSNAQVTNSQEEICKQVSEMVKTLMEKLASQRHIAKEGKYSPLKERFYIPTCATFSPSSQTMSNRSDNCSTMSFSSIPPYENIVSLSSGLLDEDVTVRMDALRDLLNFQPGDLLSSPDWKEVKYSLMVSLGDEYLLIAKRVLSSHARLFRAAIPSVQTGEIYLNMVTFLLHTFMDPPSHIRSALCNVSLSDMISVPFSTPRETKDEKVMQHILDCFRLLIHMSHRICQYWIYYQDDMRVSLVRKTLALFALKTGYYAPIVFATIFDIKGEWFEKWILSFQVRNIMLSHINHNIQLNALLCDEDYGDDFTISDEILKTILSQFLSVHMKYIITHKNNLKTEQGEEEKESKDDHDNDNDNDDDNSSEYLHFLGSMFIIGSFLPFRKAREECFPIILNDNKEEISYQPKDVLYILLDLFNMCVMTKPTIKWTKNAIGQLIINTSHSITQLFIKLIELQEHSDHHDNHNNQLNAIDINILSIFLEHLYTFSVVFESSSQSYSILLLTAVNGIVICCKELSCIKMGQELLFQVTTTTTTKEKKQSILKTIYIILSNYFIYCHSSKGEDNKQQDEKDKQITIIIKNILSTIKPLMTSPLLGEQLNEYQMIIKLILDNYQYIETVAAAIDNNNHNDDDNDDSMNEIKYLMIDIMMNISSTIYGLDIILNTKINYDILGIICRHMYKHICNKKTIVDINKFFTDVPIVTPLQDNNGTLEYSEFLYIIGTIVSHPKGFELFSYQAVSQSILVLLSELIIDNEFNLAFILADQCHPRLWPLMAVNSWLYCPFSVHYIMDDYDNMHIIAKNIDAFINTNVLLKPPMNKSIFSRDMHVNTFDSLEVGLRLIYKWCFNLTICIALENKYNLTYEIKKIQTEMNHVEINDKKRIIIDAPGRIRNKILNQLRSFKVPEHVRNNCKTDISIEIEHVKNVENINTTTTSLRNLKELREIFITHIKHVETKINTADIRGIGDILYECLIRHQNNDDNNSISSSSSLCLSEIILSHNDINDDNNDDSKKTIPSSLISKMIQSQSWFLVESLSDMRKLTGEMEYEEFISCHSFLSCIKHKNTLSSPIKWINGGIWMLYALTGDIDKRDIVIKQLQTCLTTEYNILSDFTYNSSISCSIMHLIERIVRVDLADLYSIFKINKFSLVQLSQHWLEQCMFRVVSPMSSMFIAIIPIIFGIDYQAYLMVSLLKYIVQQEGIEKLRKHCYPDDKIIDLQSFLMECYWDDFHIGINFDYMIELQGKYRDSFISLIE